jgi:hypothetical protein
MKKYLCFFFFLFTLAATAQEDAKTLTPPEGKSLIYVVRPSKLGFAVGFSTSCDDKPVGKTKGHRFIYAILEPGSHKLTTTGGEKDATLELTTEAGKTYFVELVPKMGVMLARVKMQVLEEKEGREKLEKCKPMAEKNKGKEDEKE